MKRLLGLLFILAVVAGGWFFGSQFYAAYDLREAAASGDAARLEARVDFPALRDSLKYQLSARLSGEGEGNRPLSGLGRKLAKASANLAVDTLVTPEAVAVLVRSGKLAGIEIAGREDAGEQVAWHFRQGGLNSFRLVSSDGKGALVFRRDGLGWKLAGIEFDAG